MCLGRARLWGGQEQKHLVPTLGLSIRSVCAQNGHENIPASHLEASHEQLEATLSGNMG